MKDLKWLKYGIGLGIVFFLAIFIIKPIGVSTQFSVLSGIIHKTIDPDVITENPEQEYGYSSTNAYYDRHGGKIAERIENPWQYDFVFVLAIPLGAFLVSMATKRERKVYQETEKEKGNKIEKATLLRSYLPSFLSGFLLLYGARMADGCTSGHMMSGMMQGSISGYLFAAAVFAVAIPAANLYRIRNK